MLLMSIFYMPGFMLGVMGIKIIKVVAVLREINQVIKMKLGKAHIF